MNPASRPLSRRPWLTVALIVSLAINAFFAGAIATDILRVKPLGSPESRAMRFELRWLEGVLDPASMKQVESAVMAAQPSAAAHIERLRVLRAEMAALAAVPAPDRAAIDAKLAEIRSEVEAMQAGAQAATIDAVLALPPEKRAPLAGPLTQP